MKRKDILVILIPTFIFVILWIIFSIHHAINTPTITEATDIQITSISPNFDTKTLDSLKKRTSVSPIYEIPGGTNNSSSTTVPALNPSLPIISSPSANQATSGGTLK
ncbi:MAG TPA: hypothetical protein VES68_00315 [Candidatus Sulfotelmatobacter sp.]|nr:hypothetical protein [Candidatus Sulfotelmatobacter sp.]